MLLDFFSDVLGWTYAISLGFFLYPQILWNWQRRSVRGLSIDFLTYSFVGFLCYSVFTLTFYLNNEIQEEYKRRHASENLVRFNDVIFALHGAVASLVLIIQTQVYRGSAQHLSTMAAFVTWLSILGGILVAASVHYGNGEWIHLIYYLSAVKLAFDTIQYLPQAWLNYKRKSTRALSCSLITLTLVGGLCSIAQLVLDAYIERDWSGIQGDAVKL
ncbi:hypothetical protein DM01DRAFT_257211 [Hesseltinella vesiculosa]|uniref:PQ-loop-domain-containing protein n=1 Tax=Hesseltinella vesiculosa TaxID=101127 RepID=A0A1X2GGQ3_9FUNG|nr:hypothetical protein DM01DRAFT_257211 [Hesseltinella vesiculosa]